jgi:dihydrofolate reductase
VGELIYSAIASLDGYIEDERGNVDWSEPGEAVHVVVGGGKPALPGGVHVNVELVEERRFGNGVVFLAYRTAA